ncbi:DUF2147 domain-containing protein [Fusobacterium sp.]|uniref:DUF2147 domain-containing protein n=1 Tax=Fusobacterium sp. TaxID=68766 RepID=UPI00396CBA04
MLNILKNNKVYIIILMFFSLFIYSYCEENNDTYIGYWLLPNNKVIVEIQKNEDDTYVGYVRWLKEKFYPEEDKMAGEEQVDRNNPDKEFRTRKVINLQVVGDLKRKENNELAGGWIYDSWNGKKYYGCAKIIDKNHIKLKGSIDKWNLFGYSMIIKRVDLTEYEKNFEGKDLGFLKILIGFYVAHRLRSVGFFY